MNLYTQVIPLDKPLVERLHDAATSATLCRMKLLNPRDRKLSLTELWTIHACCSLCARCRTRSCGKIVILPPLLQSSALIRTESKFCRMKFRSVGGRLCSEPPASAAQSNVPVPARQASSTCVWRVECFQLTYVCRHAIGTPALERADAGAGDAVAGDAVLLRQHINLAAQDNMQHAELDAAVSRALVLPRDTRLKRCGEEDGIGEVRWVRCGAVLARVRGAGGRNLYNNKTQEPLQQVYRNFTLQEPLQQLYHRAAGGILPHSQGAPPGPPPSRPVSILRRTHAVASCRLLPRLQSSQELPPPPGPPPPFPALRLPCALAGALGARRFFLAGAWRVEEVVRQGHVPPAVLTRPLLTRQCGWAMPAGARSCKWPTCLTTGLASCRTTGTRPRSCVASLLTATPSVRVEMSPPPPPPPPRATH